MKKSFCSLLLLFIISLCSASMAFAGDAIPGINVKAGKNPGGAITISKTKVDGKFSLTLPQGNYELTISFDDVVKALGPKKNWDGKSVTLSYNNSEARTFVPIKEVITKNSLPIMITIHKENTTISGTLTYDPVVL